MKLGLTILIVFFIHTIVLGQHYYSHNYTVNDGLPSNAVRCIYKDIKDRMWVGTAAGLCLFDGKGFKVLDSENGLVGESIFSITEDEQQNIWIGSMKGGISKYDGKTFTNYTTNEGLVSDNVRLVWYSKKFHLLFIGTDDGCSVYDGKSFISIRAEDTKTPDLFMMGFLEGKDFVCCYPYDHNKYYKYYPKTKSFQSVHDPNYSRHFPSTSPLIQPNGDTIMGNNRDGINIIHNGIKKSFSRLGQVFDMKPDQDGNVWIAGWSENAMEKKMPGGLFKYNGKDIVRYSEKVGIDDPSVWSLYYDSTFHVLWVGTLNTGLYKIPLPAFEWFDKNDFGLNQLSILSLLNTLDNSLVIGTKGNLIFRAEKGTIKIANTEGLKKNLKSVSLDFRCIREDSKGDIYTSFSQSSLVRFSPGNNFSQPQIIRILPGVTQFAFDSHDTIFYTDKWWDRVYKCSLFPKMSEPIFMSFKDQNNPPTISKMFSKGDTIWYISQTEGVFCSIKGHIDFFRKQDPTLPRNISDICFDDFGNVILGSNTGEVIIAAYQKNKLKIKYRIQAGKEVVGNTIKFLVVDNTNHLFVGTNLGLNRIDLNSLYLKNKVITNFYDTETGYYDHSGKVAVCDKKGNIWIGTGSHLLKIESKLLNILSTLTPQLKFTGIDVNYQPESSFDFGVTNKFPHSNNNLIFHFTTTNYLNPEQTFYRYKLDGLSNKWSEYTSDAKAVFTSLNHGKYRFIVEAYNRIDNSRIGSLVYTFHVSPPWYLNWLFITGVSLLFILCIYLIIRFRTIQIRVMEEKKSEFTRQLATIEMRALQSQMNPHFIFNCINSIQGFILKNKTDEALGYLMDFAKILRQTLENASKEYISLEEELQYIQYYLNLELMRFDQKFKVEILLPEDINPQTIQIPPMIIQPHVENAIRHGLLHKQDEKGMLSIIFSMEEDIFKCVIEDNGVGRLKSKEIESWRQHTHKPQSTRITQDRIDLLNKSTQSDKYKVTITDLHADKGEGSGTQVEIILPLNIL